MINTSIPLWAHTFLDRPVNNYESFKKEGAAFFLEKFNEIGLTFPNPDCTPKFHQLVCIYLCIKLQQFMLLVDLGLGKTGIMLNTIKGLQLRGLSKKKTLVLVPTLLLISEWEKELQKHRPDMKLIKMDSGNTKKRWDQLKQDADIVCLNYAGLTAMVADLVHKGNLTRSRLINNEKLKEFLQHFSTVVLDEITAVKNPKSAIFKICKEFAKHIPNRFGLTGTPFGRNLEDLWGEYYVIDGGSSLGYKKYWFDQIFFNIVPNFWGGVDKTFRRELLPKLKRLMYNSAIRYAQDECADLPQLNSIYLGLEMPHSISQFYGKVHGKLLSLFTGNTAIFQTVEQLWIQSREVCSNFINARDKFDNIQTIHIPGTSKLDRLEQIVNELPEERKMVIFHEFILSGQAISTRLKEMKINHVLIKGETKNRDAILGQFQNDQDTQILIVNSKIGALGLNLQMANYLVFYEIPVDPITYTQAIARIHRTGQTQTQFVYHLYLKNTVEESILNGIKDGRNLRAQLLQNPQSVLQLVKPA